MHNSTSSCKMNPLALHLSANTRLEENRGWLSQRQGLTATQKQVKALNAQIEMMGRDRILTADLKREKIDRMMATRNKRVQQAVERVYPYSNH
ncbi:DNA repair protein [Yersinia intermedia]|nr:DNA repair protein [Yersinia intermedia]